MTRRPHIAIVAASTDILGGQAVQARTVADALRRDGWGVTFVPVNPPFPRGLRWLRRLRYARTVVNEALYVKRLAALAGADVVHIFTASYWSFLMAAAPALLAARLLRKRAVLNYHSGEAADHLARYGALVHPWLRLADAIVVPSQYLRDVFRRHGYGVGVVPNVVDLEQFRYRERARLRPLLLSNRNLEPHYRVEDAIEAHARLLRRHPDARLVVAGTGSQGPHLAELAARVGGGSVRFVGRVEPARMPQLYDDSDVFVNASVVDNQPLSVLESFAAGLPVVTTPTGDLAAMVRNGDTGTVVAPRDPQALADVVDALVADPDRARAMARRARNEVEKHTWPAVKAGWQQVYEGGRP